MSVSLECRPALEVIAAYGVTMTCCCTSIRPTLGSTRASRQYAVEMSSAAEHHELIEALQQCRAAVALSGYPSPLYDEALTDWRRVEFDAFTGQANTAGRRTEVLWVNRDAPAGNSPRGDRMSLCILARLVPTDCPSSRIEAWRVARSAETVVPPARWPSRRWPTSGRRRDGRRRPGAGARGPW